MEQVSVQPDRSSGQTVSRQAKSGVSCRMFNCPMSISTITSDGMCQSRFNNAPLATAPFAPAQVESLPEPRFKQVGENWKLNLQNSPIFGEWPGKKPPGSSNPGRWTNREIDHEKCIYPHFPAIGSTDIDSINTANSRHDLPWKEYMLDSQDTRPICEYLHRDNSFKQSKTQI